MVAVLPYICFPPKKYWTILMKREVIEDVFCDTSQGAVIPRDFPMDAGPS